MYFAFVWILILVLIGHLEKFIKYSHDYIPIDSCFYQIDSKKKRPLDGRACGFFILKDKRIFCDRPLSYHLLPCAKSMTTILYAFHPPKIHLNVISAVCFLVLYVLVPIFSLLYYHFGKNLVGQGFPWWSSGSDSKLPMQGAQVQSLVRELDPTCKN